MRKKRLWCPRLRNLWKNWKKPEQRVPDPINTRIFPAGQKTERSLIRSLLGKTLHQEIAELAYKEDLEEIKALLKKFYQEFFGARQAADYRTGEFREVFGDHPGREYYECVCPANVDLICSNIFMGEKENQIIDYEWMFDFPVPEFYHVAPDP